MPSDRKAARGELKHQRLQGACDRCRQRKIRCDSGKMPDNRCSTCIAFSAECTHLHATKKAVYQFRPPRINSRDTHENIEDYHEKMQPLIETILSPTYQAPGNPAIIRSTLISLALYARALKKRMSCASTIEECSDEGSPEQAELQSDSDPIDHLPEWCETGPKVMDECMIIGFAGLSLDVPQSRFFGPSSCIDLLKTAFNFGRDSVEGLESMEQGVERYRRPEFWVIQKWEVPAKPHVSKLVFPEPDLLNSLVTLYFERIDIFLPILHRPTFEKSVRAGLHLKERDFGSSVLAVCANASRYSDDPRVISEGANSELSAGYQWFKQLKLFRENFYTAPSLYELQIYFLAVVYLQGTSMADSCWYVTGMGIRAAQDAGIHRRDPNLVRPTVESELRKRIWWALALADSFVSIACGRPRAIRPSDYDLDLPIACDDEYWENEDPSLAFTQPPGRPSQVHFFNNMLCLFGVLGSALDRFYCVRPQQNGFEVKEGWEESALGEMDSLLNAWVDSVPDHLRWDPNRADRVFLDQSAALFINYYWVQILVHRPFMATRNRLTKAFSSLAICTNAARACSRISDAHAHRSSLPAAITQAAIFQAAIVLLLSIWQAKHTGIPFNEAREMAAVHRCAKLIAAFERRIVSAGRFHDVLKSLSLVSNLPWPTTSDVESTEGAPSRTARPMSDPEQVSKGHQDANWSSLPHISIDLPLYSTDLSKPIFHSYQQVENSSNNPSPGDFETIFSQPLEMNTNHGHHNDDSVHSLSQSFDFSPTDSSENMSLDDIALWVGVPSGYDWSGWGAYIASVEALGQTAQNVF
ncbi:hypothetical protein FA15DRAFT_671065 [Coprinopsis marcescibilis]|uniref:Zn(2)-C6 fungal-type domain-containing protein n=1 Tax=Coprinopsis marcescibilis TaxID=230819 RepID=A0A5C3KQQ5_COPMA|nr:hypothetical protein FA15DRAFT_671065 [Coprinopsis marcescibilis]